MVKLTEEQRKSVILEAAVRLAKREGLHMVTHGNVAKECKIETSLHTVRLWFKTKKILWDAAVDHDGTGTLRKEMESLTL